MNREVFINELIYLLQDIPEEEKADALDYYRDYLEEAGDDAEEAIREFGSPERIAAIIRSDIAGHLEEGGEFTERGYEDERFRDPNYQVAKRYELPEQSDQGRYAKRDGRAAYHRDEKQRKNVSSNSMVKIILWIVLFFVTSPIWLGLAGGLLGILTGAAALLIGILIVGGVLTVTFFIVGIVVIVSGAVYMAVNPIAAVLAIGIGLLVLGLGFISLVVGVLLYGRLVPWLFRGIVNIISGLVYRREGRR